MMNLRAKNGLLNAVGIYFHHATKGLAFADFAEVEIPETLSPLTAWRSKVAARPSIAG